MWEYNAHRAAVEDALHKAIAALVGDAHERCDPRVQGGGAEKVGVGFGEDRVLEFDEDGVVAVGFGDLNRGWVGADADAKGLGG